MSLWMLRGDDGGDGDQTGTAGRKERSGRRRLELSGVGKDQRGSSEGPERLQISQDAPEAVGKRGADGAAALGGASRSDPEGGLSHVSKERRGGEETYSGKSDFRR